MSSIESSEPDAAMNRSPAGTISSSSVFGAAAGIGDATCTT